MNKQLVLTLAVLPAAAAAIAAVTPARAGAAPLPGATVTPLSGARPAPHLAATPVTGSIVFLKNNNIWIMAGDGSQQRAVTTDGTAANPYRSPSQSDSAVIVAARGSLIVRMTQAGKVLNTLDPPMLVDSAGEHLDGAPTEVSISPNGKTIAWTYSFYGCPPGLSCGVRLATGYTAATRISPAGTYATSFYGMPSWIGNTRTLQTGTTSAVELQDVTSPEVHWFYDGDYANPPSDLTDGELSDDGRQLVMTRGYGSSMTILWYTVKGNARTGVPPKAPVPNCITNASPNVGSPTFAPHGAALAYSYPEGIYIVNTPASCGAFQPALVAPGGTHPDWSKAPLK